MCCASAALPPLPQKEVANLLHPAPAELQRRHRGERRVVQDGPRIDPGKQVRLLGAVLRLEELPAGPDAPLVAVIVGCDDVRQPGDHQRPRPLAAGLRREQGRGVHLHPRADLAPAGDGLGAAAGIALGMSQQGMQPDLHHPRQRGADGIEGDHPGELDEEVARAADREASDVGRLRWERAVEHHFRAAVQSGQRQRRRLQCGVGGFVCLGRDLGEVAGAEVRSQADVGDPAGHLLLHDLDRLGHGAGAVVHPRQQMGVEIDHAAAAPSRSSAAANVPSRSGACWAWARRARVTRASAASRSSATDRSPARASTRSRARPPEAANASGDVALEPAWDSTRSRRASGAPTVSRSSQGAVRRRSLQRASRPRARPRRARGWRHAPGVAWWHPPPRRRRSGDGRRPGRR